MQPVFFTQQIDAALAGQPPIRQLDILARMIADAEHDKADGYGPPLDEINKARRRWLRIFNGLYAGRVAA